MSSKGFADVLELVREDVAWRWRQPGGIVQRRHDRAVGDVASGRIFVRRKDDEPVTEPSCRLTRHPSELSAAEHADGRSGG